LKPGLRRLLRGAACARLPRAVLATLLFLVIGQRAGADPAAADSARSGAAGAGHKRTGKSSEKPTEKPAGKPPDASHAPAAATPRRQQELQSEQRELKARLAQMKKSLASKESAHSEAADALAASETAISTANRHLQQLAGARRQVEKRIAELQASGREAAAAQSAHASLLGLALRDEYMLGQRPGLDAIVDPAQGARAFFDAAYLDSVVRERTRRIGELHDRRTELAARESESVQRRAELDRIDTDERSSRTQLLHQEAARKATLMRLAREIATQRQSVASLERDDARLGNVIEQIGKVLADQARRRAAARSRAPADGRQGAADERAQAASGADRHFEPPSSTRFARFRGKLILPVQGTIGSRYGAARLGEDGRPQDGAPAWKGLFIRADAGSPVHAVAAGRVVFADWLRGFGNLLILDHGEGFLSVYANNETLLHNVGEEVAADDVVAAVGNTGGNTQSGLYFEMRFQGRPFDPLAWAVAR
jgi:septal ring factor EnvC (AmiA/AmiB activator)